MSERIVKKRIPTEMAKACFAQSQAARCRPDQCSGERAEIGFMADQKASALE